MRRIIVCLLAFALVCVTGFCTMFGIREGVLTDVCLSSSTVQLEGEDNQSKIYNYWIRNGFSAPQAAGITANMKNESGYSPFRQEEAASWPQGGYGIAQFTGGQRQAVTQYMSEQLGNDFGIHYSDLYGGAVSADNGYVPSGIPEEVNDKFLLAQLGYLNEYMSSFKPSTIPARTSGLQALTGLTVPNDMTLREYILTLHSAGDVAKAWTFLYEYPAHINDAAIARAGVAEFLLAQFTAQSAAPSPEVALAEQHDGSVKSALGTMGDECGSH